MRAALAALALGAAGIAAAPLFAPIDGSQNNLLDAAKGTVGSRFSRRLGLAFYADGKSSIDETLPAPRVVSNVLFGQPPFRYNKHEVSFIAAFMGQFVAHDMIMTMGDDRPGEVLNITVPRGDKDMDPAGTGTQRISFKRLQYDPTSGTSQGNPRAPVNGQTHFLDASAIYGSSDDRVRLLRTFNGGLLIADPVNGLPRNTGDAVPMGGPLRNSAAQRFAGDPRANVNPGLLCLHAVFVLEHNYQARKLAEANSAWDDERLFQEARKRVMALLQNVVYKEYVPLLLGEGLPEYAGYDPTVDASVDIAFAVAAYRYGHSGINSMYWCAEEDGTTCASGNLLLRDVYFNPRYLEYTTIAHYLRGSILQPESAIDTVMVDDVRNFLEGIRNDLAAVDVLRGRDAGIPSFSRARQVYGLQPPSTFADITSNTQIAAILSQLYGGDVTKVDLWVGGLAEQATSGAFVGPTFKAIIREQFIRTRDGDRFWFENDQLGHYEGGKFVPYLSEEERDEIRGTTMADIIRRNTDAKSIPDSVMRVPKEWVQAGATDGGSSGGSGSGSSGGTGASKRSQQLSPAVSIEWVPPAAGAEEIEITATLKGTGWFAIGLGQGMRDADVIMMRVQGGTPEVIDAKAGGYMLPAPDSSQDTKLVSGSESGGVSTVTFRRKLDTGDAAGDKPITAGANNVICAWDPSSDTFAIHGANRVAGLSVDFLSGGSSGGGGGTGNGTGGSSAFPTIDFDEQIRNAKLAAYGFHGISMFATWGCLVPAGVFTVRFAKHLKSWQAFHRWSMMLAASITVPAAGAALASAAGGTAIAHQYIGVTVAVTLIIEIVAGTIMRQFMRGSKVPPTSFFWTKWFHRGFGWLLTISGMVNCYLGVAELLPEIKYYVLGFFVVITFAFVILAVFEDMQKDKLSSPSKLKTTTDGKLDRSFIAESHQSLTMHDVKMAIRAGNKWVLLDGWVFDVSNFLYTHPGGAFLIEGSIGTDVGQFFFGRDAFSERVGKHVHSQRAHTLLRGMCVGVLKSTATGQASSNWADRTSGDRAEDAVTWTVAKRTIINPGADREVVRLEFRNSDSVGTPAASWRPSTFGRYMLVRFPVENADGAGDIVPTSSSVRASKRRGSLATFLGAASPSEYVERPYTIVRRDNRDGFDLYVRRYPLGEVSPLVHKLAVGDEATMLGPKGVGIHLDDNSHGVVVAVAQGTGVFTFFDVITYLLAKRREALHKGLTHTQSWRRPAWRGSAAGEATAPAYQKHREESWGLAGKGDDRSSSAGSSRVAVEPMPYHSEGGGVALPAVEERASERELGHSSDDDAALIIPEGAMRQDGGGSGPGSGRGMQNGSAGTGSRPRTADASSSSTGSGRKSTAWVDGKAAPEGMVGGVGKLVEGGRSPPPLLQAKTLDPEAAYASPTYAQQRAGGGSKATMVSKKAPYGAASRFADGMGDDPSRQKSPKLNRIKLVLIACFANEDNVLEGEWLNKCAREIPDFELFINVKTANRSGAVLRNFQNPSTGYLTDEKLASLLPQKDLLFVSICGTTSFNRTVQDKFIAMGLPRGLVSVV
ncbi:hypothetical protein FNF29_05642 [Cafeteria roenbergensis]|uniref:Cytochrome b5 heme-binding domain-containing protein n=1 Tax=Cafeteria roenbergensis TaxID=33653 RepID=A0A5A8C9K7_CAFRO|nr:hypothetical protein FNF29_05642 [Cafeteria roenbergensis]|eukprot:KAA0149816.1 hypothetical protein FNF29_05642 [Cafeteria roenbergensis]